MTATVWQLGTPKYSGGDAESSHTNGELEWPCDVPDFDCTDCRRARSGEDERNVALWLSDEDAEVLGDQDDFDTPEEFDEFMTGFAQRVSGDPRNAEFMRVWRERRTVVPLPVTLQVASIPTAAVLHSSGEILIREDVAEALSKAGPVRGAHFPAVDRIEIAGRASRRAPPSAKFKPGHSHSATPRRYTLLVVGEVTGPPVGVTRRRCSRCGRVIDEWKERHLVLPSASWREGVDFAYMASTRHVLVSDRVKQLLERDPTPDVTFERVVVSATMSSDE